MHRVLADKIVGICRQRHSEGDCPTVEGESQERLELALIEIADHRDQAVLELKETAGNELLELTRLRAECATLRSALLPCVGWLEYAYRNVDSPTSVAVKAHLPTMRAAIANEQEADNG